MVERCRAEPRFLIQALTERPDQKPYLSDIRLAIRTGQRPTAIIMHDRYAGHRDYDDPYWEVTADEIKHTSYTEWDYALIRACQFIEDYTDRDSGQLLWYDQSDEVEWETMSQYSNSQAEIARATEARGEKGLEPGESIHAIPVFKNPDKKPTMYDWFEDVSNGELKPGVAKSSGYSANEILDAREQRDLERAEILKKLKNGG